VPSIRIPIHQFSCSSTVGKLNNAWHRAACTNVTTGAFYIALQFAMLVLSGRTIRSRAGVLFLHAMRVKWKASD